MKKKFVRFLTVLLLMVLGLSMGACSKVENTSSSNGKDAAAKETEEVKDLPKADYKVLKEGEPYHIGVVTGTVSQSEDEFRAAQAAIEEFGADIVKNDTYPDRFEAEIETTIQKITAMADDPDMKAIIVNQSVPGTSAAFQKIREKRPDIILINLTPQEDVIMVEKASDLCIDVDNISRGYRIVKAAKEVGATKFAHITFPRHMSIEMLALRRAIFEEACKDEGLEFISLNAPDPTTDIGIPGAQQYVAENIQSWIDKYGKDTCFFCTNDAHTEPLLRGVAQGGAIFIEPDLPSPIMGYPNAFSVDLSDIAGNWQAINKRVEEAVVKAGGGGRMGSWAYSLGYTEVRGAVDHVIKVLHGQAELTNVEDIKASLHKYTEGANWMASKFVDRQNGQEVDNHVLISQDTYLYGKGYMGMDKVQVPDKYKNLNVDLEAIEKSQEQAEGQAE